MRCDGAARDGLFGDCGRAAGAARMKASAAIAVRCLNAKLRRARLCILGWHVTGIIARIT